MRKKLVASQTTLSIPDEFVLANCLNSKTSKRVGVFASQKNLEIDSTGIIELCFKLNKTVYLPSSNMEFYELHSLAELDTLAVDKWGIKQPVGDDAGESRPSLDGCLDVMFIPGLAFDLQGNRLGRGAGCYDRYLSLRHDQPFECTKIGVCYDFQLIDEIMEIETHDIKMDYVITESRLVKIQ